MTDVAAAEAVKDILKTDAETAADEAVDRVDGAINPREETKKVIDILEPAVDARAQIIRGKDPRGNPIEKTYVQKPLSYFGKMQFFALVGDSIDAAMEGEDGLTVNSMLDTITGAPNDLSAESLTDVDAFARGIAKLLKYVPDLLIDSYCIWLNIPYEERAWARVSMTDAETGLSDKDGMEILATFVDQNAEAIRDFFGDLWNNVIERSRKRLATAESTTP